MRKLLAVLIAALIALPAGAAWDPTKPESASPTRQSSEIRANWAALAQGIGGPNVVADNSFLLWAAGDAAAPTLYTLDSGTIARTGTGLADTTRKFGPFAAKVTSGAGSSHFQQTLMGASYDGLTLEGLALSCGAWVNTSTPAAANTCVVANALTCGTYHTGNGQWQWLTVTGSLAGAATEITWRLNIDTAATAVYVSGPTCVVGSVPPSYPQPSGWEPFVVDCFRAGAQTTGTDKVDCHWQSPYYGIVQDVSLKIGTAPTGQALIVDLNTWDGAAYTSMYSTRPQIASTATRSVAAPPDSTYARAIIVPQHGTTLATDGELSLDVDQVGSGAAGSDLRVQIRGIRIARPLQPFLGATE